MKKLLTGTTVAAGLAMLAAAPAIAVPLNTTFTVATFHGSNPSPGSATDPTQQALPSAITAIAGTSGASTANFTYTGPLNLSAPTQASNTLGAFFTSAGGTISSTAPGSLVLSTSNYATETLIEFTFTTAAAISGTITHDDGVSLFAAGSSTNLVPNASAPTVAVPASYSISAGTYNLYFSEDNAAPAQLNFDVASSATVPTVPEPASMALLGAGLFGLGLVRRRFNRG